MASQFPPKKNTAFTLYFTLYKNDGTIIANPGTITKKVSIDGAAVADITASVTEEDTTYGQCSVVLADSEMNGDAIWIYIKDDTSGCVPFTCTIYTAANLMDDIKTDTAAILADTGTDGVVVAAGSKTGFSLAADQSAVTVGTVTTVGSVTGAVGSVTGAVGSVTGAVGSVAGNVDGSVASVTAGVTLANGAHGGAAAAITLADYSAFKATGFSTHSAADVKTAIEAGGGHIALIKAKTDNLPADPADDSDIDTQLAAIAGYIDTEITTLVTELAKVPKSDSNVTWNATALASINAEVDTALNTAIPAAPTAGSMNAYIQQVKFVIKNKMEITEADGATTIYKDDGTTPYCSVAAAFSSDSTTTTRKALA